MSVALLYSVHNVRVLYAGRTVLDIPELSIPDHTILGISGPNGSGKSTLLRLLAFLEDPDQGVIRFREQEPRPSKEALRRRITLLTQSPYLLKRSVYANLAYGPKVRKEKGAEERIRTALTMVGLPPEIFARRAWHQLSGGERQRVALASRLVLQPEVLLLDEPTSNLDQESTDLTRQAILQAHVQWGTNLILVSHDHKWLTRISQQILFLHKGQIIPAGDDVS
ncbi:ABC transporter ATP-binding protein [Desulfovermiculus halophilus]|jgi:tungstate transport system ATP-binding protein|uniref:ABC transporter ATP-binding protein n=1 Tax=Desulfovermiculus halophilus TaxID=339722 RepID=UPI000480B982|nr:ATP-binding cassette domain-containing protein [Desulfovermiculus halophilus]